MPIKFKCPNPACGKALSVNESLAGKRAKCPTCQTTLTIPAASAPAPAAAPAQAPMGKPAPARAPAAPRPAKPAAPPPPEDLEKLAADLLSDKPQEEAGKPQETVDFDCPMCGEPIKMAISYAGKQGPCPECRRVIKVPNLAEGRKADWRTGPAKPTGARQDDQPALEGAWGTATDRGHVSGESLAAAGALPDKREPVTVRQWIARGLVGTTAVVALVGGTLFALSWFGAKKQEALLARALDAVKGKQTPEAGAIHLGAAQFHRQRDENDCITGAREQLKEARGKFAIKAGENAHFERDALLIEVALAQLEMGGTGQAVEERRKLKWDDVRGENVRNEVLQTLMAIRPPEGKAPAEARSEAVRLVTRQLLKLGQPALAEKLARQIPGPESAAVAGVELFRAGETKLAENLATMMLGFYPQEANKPKEGEKPAPKQTLPPLTAEAVALLTLFDLEKRLPKVSDLDQKDAKAVGMAMKLAAEGDGEKARELAKNLRPGLKVELLAAVADAAKKDEDGKAAADEAVKLVVGPLRDQPFSPWVRARLVRLGIEHNLSEAELTAVAKRIPDAGQLHGWAELRLFRARLEAEHGKADEALLDMVDPGSLSHRLARIEFARRNTRHDKATIDAIEKWDDALRPFGLVGAALGLQDAKK